jgi:hypothetical protein
LRLWEENTQWGALTPETWRQRYIDPPHGPSLVVMAVDENDAIAGQLILTSVRVIVDDREVCVLRLSAPILRKDLNRVSLRSMDHPLYRLYKRGEEAALTAGYDLWYGLPRYGWLPMFPLLSHFVGREILFAEYPCLGITITPTVSVATEEYAGFLSVRPVTDFGTQYERLWQAAKDSFPIACGVVRSSSLLRYNSAHSLMLEVCDRRYGTLVGYASVRRQPPVLYDILARSPATLTPVLAGVLNWLATHGGGGGSDDLRYLNAM